MKRKRERAEIVNAVAAGLRAMDKDPKAILLFGSDMDHIWNENSILGIPVFRAEGVDSLFSIVLANSSPFVPLDVGIDNERCFVDAYDDRIGGDGFVHK